MASGAFCPSCGSPTPAGARYCANCGTALRAASPSQPEPPPPSPSQWDPPGQGQSGVSGAARQGFGWALGCLTFGIVLVVGVLGLVYVLSTAAPSATVSPGSTLRPDSTPAVPSSLSATGSATLSGTDDQTGPPFTLSGGDFVLTWSATSSRDTSASPFAAFVVDRDGLADSSSVDTEIPAGQKRSGTEYLYGLAAGEHHFKIITNDTSWQVSIAPR